MKKYLLIVYILLLAMTLGAANPASVSITLTTSVPGYLYHGFLDGTESYTFVSEPPSVSDAFDPAGATLNYGIKTNVGLSLVVNAKIQDFTHEDGGPNADVVRISQVEVIPPNGPAMTLPHTNTHVYTLSNFTSTSGTIFYPYTLTVYANQSDVMSKSRGNYQSTVEINIGVED